MSKIEKKVDGVMISFELLEIENYIQIKTKRVQKPEKLKFIQKKDIVITFEEVVLIPNDVLTIKEAESLFYEPYASNLKLRFDWKSNEILKLLIELFKIKKTTII